MFCKNCGYSFSEELEACPKCGKSKKETETVKETVESTNAVQQPVQPQVKQPENRKKGKKINPALKITAIVLAVAILLVGILSVFFGFKNKNDIPEDAWYIEDFPVISNETAFIVYNKEKFPSQEYEIKVEKYLFSGVLKDISARREVFTRISTSKVYDLSLEDGSYRITLTDQSVIRDYMHYYQDMGEEEFKDVVPVIVIEVTVDAEAEDAVNRVDVNSKPGGEMPSDNSVNLNRETVEATEADFAELEKMIYATMGYQFALFDCETATAEEAIDNFLPYIGWSGYSYYFGSGTEKISTKDGNDPLEKWYYEDNEVGYAYYTFDGENVKWICENIFHVKYDPNFELDHCYAYEGVVYKLAPDVGDEYLDFNFVSHEYKDGKYEFIVETTHIYDEGYFGVHKLTAALEMIDGKKYWTVYSVEKYSQAAEESAKEENSVNLGKEDEEVVTTPPFSSTTTTTTLASSINPNNPTSTTTTTTTKPTQPATQQTELPKIKVSRKPAPTIAAGNLFTVAVKNDGTIAFAGHNAVFDFSGWRNIVSVAAGSSSIFGVKSDGTVVATGNNSHGQTNVSGWKNIVYVSAGPWHTVGLRSDGTVVATGTNDAGQCNVSQWTDIVDVVATASLTLGLKSDGTVVSTMNNYMFGEWHNIVKLSSGYSSPCGIKSDGTIISNFPGTTPYKVMPVWKNITKVSVGNYTLGLKKMEQFFVKVLKTHL